MITKIEFTGTPVSDIKRARAFYENTLGLNPTREALGGKLVEYHLGTGIFTIACLGAEWKPSADGTFVAFEVDNLEAEVERLRHKGVTLITDIIEIPTSRFVLILDPDGNKIMMHKATTA